MPAAQTVEENENAQAILEYLRRHASRLPPTREEIRAACGIGSTGTVQRWLKRLAQRGLIHLDEHRSRAIWIDHDKSRNQS